MNNMDIYNAFRTTPKEALKPITEGKLKGKSDINPMFRIEQLTKQFGPCGIGWKVVPTRIEYLAVPQRDEVMCFVDINLYYKQDGQWSEPVFGTGGSMLVENFRSAGIKSNDDGYKMAYTDAISVACKLLGMSADVYWAAGETKYSRPAEQADEPAQLAEKPAQSRPDRIKALCQHHNITIDTFGEFLKELQADGKLPKQSTKQMTDLDFNTMLSLIHNALQATKKESA